MKLCIGAVVVPNEIGGMTSNSRHEMCAASTILLNSPNGSRG